MLQGPARERVVARRLVQSHIRSMVASGIILALLLVVLSLGGVINQIIWVRYVMRKSDAQTAVEQGAIIAPNLYRELELRIQDPDNKEAINAVHIAWQEALEHVKGTFNEDLLPDLTHSVEQFEQSLERGEILFFYIDVMSKLTAMVFLMLQHTYNSRAFATARSLSLFSTYGALGSLIAREAYVAARPLEGAKNTKNYLSWQSGNSLMMQYVTCNTAPIFSKETFQMMLNHLDIIKLGYEMYTGSSTFAATTKTIELLSLDSLSTFMDTLSSVTGQKIKMSKSEVQPLYFMAIAFVLITVAFILCTIFFCRYYRRTRISRNLVEAFESKMVKQHLHLQYMPVLQDLRPTSGRDEGRSNELARVYSIAASWLDVLRVATPQLLFGRPDGTATEWAVAARKARFGIRKPDERHHVVMMEVTLDITGNGESPLNELELGVQLEIMNAAYRIVVGEVNRAGGVVLGTRGNLSILAVWNTTWTSHNAEVLALRAGYTIEHCLKEVRGLPRVLIALVTGPMVAGNIECGGRRYACAMSTSMSYLAVMKRVGQAMGCTLMVDRATNRRLPRAVSRRLKPVVVLRIMTASGGNNYVVYSCNDKAMEDEEQAAHYIRGFTLYQNNLLTEALAAFDRYLAMYPDDTGARWLLEFVIKPKYYFSVEKETDRGVKHLSAGRQRLGNSGLVSFANM